MTKEEEEKKVCIQIYLYACLNIFSITTLVTKNSQVIRNFFFFSLCVHRSSSNSSILCDNFIILLYRDKHGHTHQMSSIERKKEKKYT
jgi:hypothetical protein